MFDLDDMVKVNGLYNVEEDSSLGTVTVHLGRLLRDKKQGRDTVMPLEGTQKGEITIRLESYIVKGERTEEERRSKAVAAAAARPLIGTTPIPGSAPSANSGSLVRPAANTFVMTQPAQFKKNLTKSSSFVLF